MQSLSKGDILAYKNKNLKTTVLLVLMAIVGYVGFNAKTRAGLEFRFPEFNFAKHVDTQLNKPYDGYGSANDFINDCDFVYGKPISKRCYSKNSDISNQIFLWGDSYAQMLTYGFIKNIPKNWQLIQVSSRGCQASIYENNPSSDYCKQSNYFAMEQIRILRPKIIVIAQNSTLNQKNAELFEQVLHQLGVKKIIFVGKPPEWRDDLPTLLFRKFPKPLPIRSVQGLNSESIREGAQLSSLIKLMPENKYIDIASVLCNSEGCLTYIGDDPAKGITSLDDRHLTPVASDLIVRMVLMPEIINQ
jgi:hypothetical protein